MSRRDGYVYFIQAGDGGPIKIGSTTKHPRDRLAQLQCGNAEILRVVKLTPGAAWESFFHQEFAKYRVRGEWYSAEILDLMSDEVGP